MEALVDLTGGSVHSIDLTQCKGENVNETWAVLQTLMSSQALVSVMSVGEDGDYSQDGDTVSLYMICVYREKCTHFCCSQGLVKGSAYTILKTKEIGRLRFVHLKNTARQNPWSSGEWKGDWSNDSSKWYVK